MAKTPNLNISSDVHGSVPLKRTVKELVEAVDQTLGFPEAIVSDGGAITIPANSTLAEALKIIVDAVDPGDI